ncbi:Protein kinase domain family protein [Acanthocheilonema viteae]
MTDYVDLDDDLDTGDETDQSEALETSASDFYKAFEVKDILGYGLASTVRLCIEKGTGLEFAVKIVDISTERQSEAEARRLYNETISEVNLLRKLSDHPSIINIHDFYETPAFLFAVFEMAPKGELFDVLNKSVTVSEKKARRLMQQLFDGVAYMHDKNIVHRDIKLENILCIDDERIVISDFGFATQLQPGQKLKELLGTPGYLAPEMLKCQMYEDEDGYSVEVDDWALGVILYTF